MTLVVLSFCFINEEAETLRSLSGKSKIHLLMGLSIEPNLLFLKLVLFSVSSCLAHSRWSIPIRLRIIPYVNQLT